MKKGMLAILIVVLLTSTQVHAGNGDLIVDGKVGVGTTTPVSPITLGDAIPASTWTNGSKVQINDRPSITSSGTFPTFNLITQPNVSANSTAKYVGSMNVVDIPATTFNYLDAIGTRNDLNMNGTGNLNMQHGGIINLNNKATGSIGSQYGLQVTLSNPSGSVGTQNGIYVSTKSNSSSNLKGVAAYVSNGGSGTTNGAYGNLGQINNTSTGSLSNAFGTSFVINNSNTGSIANAYGSSNTIANFGKGSISTAYGLFTEITNVPGSTINSGYGIYVGRVQATAKYSVYASDATAPSIFLGNVGIGTTTPAANLDVAGTILGRDVSGNTVNLTSDARFKKNIIPVSTPLDKVMSLNGVSYEWKTEEYKDRGFKEGRHYGVIAQEIEKVLPEVVIERSDGTKAVAYSEIIPVLIEAIKEQQKEIEILKKKLSHL